jgi:hypothetical protein
MSEGGENRYIYYWPAYQEIHPIWGRVDVLANNPHGRGEILCQMNRLFSNSYAIQNAVELMRSSPHQPEYRCWGVTSVTPFWTLNQIRIGY